MNKLLILFASLVLTTGCLVHETRHTIYLDPDGATTWVVEYADVRSDAEDAEQRAEEERAFLADAEAGRHDVAQALDLLGPRRLSTRVLRGRRPYAVTFEAQYERVDRLARRFLELADVPGFVELWQEDDHMRLVITADTSRADEDAWSVTATGPVTSVSCSRTSDV